MKYCNICEKLKRQLSLIGKMFMIMGILFYMAASDALAQEKAVKGMVVDDNNQPMIGVNVVLKGKTVGTVTDVDGKYSINATEKDVLVFSFLGYTSVEVSVGTQSQITVTLKETVSALNEVVVVGYGVQKKSDLTGSVSSVKADDIKAMPVSRVDEALQGKAAGVMIMHSTGQPGAEPKIRVRGYATINGGNPLIIIDGVSGGSLSDLNPGDIESIEILKDAGSASIYGSSGGNGVILVTTKKGSSGKWQVNFDMYSGIQEPWSTDQLKVANSQQFAEIYNQSNHGYFPYDPASDTYRVRGDSLTILPNNKWIDKIFRDATVQNYNVSINKSGKKYSVYSSLGFSNEEGILKRTYNKKITFRLNSDFQIIKRLKIGESLNISQDVSSNQVEIHEYESPLSTAVQFYPFVPEFAADSSGNYAFKGSDLASNIINPMASIAYTNRQNTSKTVFGNVYIKLDIIEGLSFESHLGGNSNRSEYIEYDPKFTLGDTADASASLGKTISAFKRNPNTTFGWQFQNYFTYNTTLAELHELTLTAGMEAGSSENSFVNRTANNVTITGSWEDYTDTAGMVALNPKKTNITRSYAYFGRVNYTFAKIILLQANIRNDNSSRFGPNNRSGIFPSISGGLKFSELEGFKLLNIFDFGKIRAGYGETGNSDIQPFLYNSTLGILPINSYPFGNPLVVQKGAALLTAGNADLGWETVITSNIGVDLGFLKNRLTFTYDYFVRKNKNMLLRKSLPDYLGYVSTHGQEELGDPNLETKPLVNYGTLNNKGYEISIGYKDKIGDFEFEINGNISHITTTVDSIGEPLYGGSGRGISNVCVTKKGDVVSAFYGYKIDGLYKESDFTWYYNPASKQWARTVEVPGGKIAVGGHNESGDTVTYYTNYNSPEPGDFKYKDTNEDGIIDSKDYVNIGDPNPKFTYGFSASLKYKYFDLNMFFQGSYGNKVFNMLKVNLYNIDNGGCNISPDLVNSYIPATYSNTATGGDASILPAVITEAQNTNTGVQSAKPTLVSSDFFVEDGSYLRLKNIQLGFTLPSSLTQKVKIQRLRIYVGAKNLLTFTKYKGFDPEVGENSLGGISNSILERGFDRGTYPQAKMYLVGLNLTF
jgi:TonB-dependent starch-binding outer membrane protein SusC